MSDDVPLILAEDSPTPTAVFLSASSASQMQQYTAAGWAIAVTPKFQPLRAINIAEADAQVVDEPSIIRPTLVSCEAQTWTAASLSAIVRWQPRVIKVNCAFSELESSQIQAISKELAAQRLTVVAAHWRDDNTYRFISLNRIDFLDNLHPPEWTRLNFIACADEKIAKMIIKIGKLHVGQEQRIAQLRVSEAVRNDHIASLEKALVAAQQSPYFKPPS